jgi:uncharacterized protein involved in type VI secretion and phage assembly
MTPFYGKFRGVVTDNRDPLQIGRIRARVPDVTGEDETGWAMPCFPAAGQGMGVFALPATGAGVWIEFEHGNPDYPIWSGAWFGNLSELPPELLIPPMLQDGKILLKTTGGTSIILDDTPGTGGIILETATGQKITMGVTGIEIDNGQGAKITMGPGPMININNGALEII